MDSSPPSSLYFPVVDNGITIEIRVNIKLYQGGKLGTASGVMGNEDSQNRKSKGEAPAQIALFFLI
jgi:hypothetical protein